MNLSEAATLFATKERLKHLEGLISDKETRHIRLKGLAGSSPALLFASLPKRDFPYIIVANDAETGAYLFNDLCHAIGNDEEAAFFPSGYKRHIKYGRPDPPAQIMRTETLDAISTRKNLRFVVTSPDALAEKVPTPANLSENTLVLESGKKNVMSDTIIRLRELGFKETDYVYEPGQFARRGSILDIFSYSNEYPFRADYFDDEIDSLRTFNVETQLSIDRLEQISVIPARAAETPDGVSLPEFILSSAPERKKGKGDEDPTPELLILCESSAVTLNTIKDTCNEEFSESAIIAEEGDPEAMKKVVDYSRIEDAFTNAKIIDYGLGGLPAGRIAATSASAEINYNCTLQTIYHKNFDLIAESFTGFVAEGYRILILSDSDMQTERLKEIFKERGEKIEFTAVSTTIHEGFADNDNRICYFTDHQIFDRFHKYSLRSDMARRGKMALSLKELNQIEIGDYIVHIDHGIGRFGGLLKTDTNGRPQEMIKLLYQNDDIILVSIHALHKLSKYRGKEGIPPKISKLGTGAWIRLKDRTKQKMKDMARDLIRLYAARREEAGFKFSPDSYLQQELEASFIYEDTPDQLKATEAIKADMESPRPMDRLICGDVGFGKTELAIRAAFKAATDSKQTAVLVPTTVLAMQHYHTFKERLKDLPVTVEFLSRAKKPAEVKRILDDLAKGKIDILIGTHKLIGKNVKFKDLGLLIVDEEQKFGVAVKEKLKQMKVNVDTLTMSATPIPRTLQFSLMGARDLSALNTPPANRRPVQTVVSGVDDNMLSEAINFELSRGGQVFYVSNRISNLVDIEAHIRRIVPKVRIITAHGQMPPEKLEKAVLDFQAGDYDILLSTTIMENGIDMPNVNTIIIDNAQNFGLSELHQLRGRVGRSSRKAFCYLLVPAGLPLTPVARRRLQAIESLSDLGAGIHIAMQDLDIRGAGNLLGAEQSGFIADLGYEAYQKILKEAVTELRTREFADSFEDMTRDTEAEFVADCAIESDLELRIPPEYVPQESERIMLYQRLDNMERKEQIDEFRDNLTDRFGKIPAATEELIRVVPLRMEARRLGIERLTLKSGRMALYFVGDDNKAYYESAAFGRVLTYLQRNVMNTRLRDANGRRSMLISDVTSVTRALDILKEILSLPVAK